MTESSSLRRLGNSGLAVSVVGLGTNNFGMKLDLEQCRAVVHAALDQGINLFDTSDSYGASEERLGEVLQGKRDDVLIATKFGSDVRRLGQDNGVDWGARGSRRYIRRAVENSLRRLRTDWIDLYQFHRADPLTPVEETLRALENLVRQGKVRYFGCSNMPAWQMVEAQWTARQLGQAGFVSCQDEYSLLVRGIERDVIPASRAYGMGLLPYFPLASGLLTGKYRRNAPMPQGARLTTTQRFADQTLTDANWAITERLTAFAEARGHTLLELAFSWLLAREPVASVIAGATRPEQIQQNVAAGAWKLTDAELAEIDLVTDSK